MRVHVYGDEFGDFAFSRAGNASRYFIITTATTTGHGVAGALLDLRRELAWDNIELGGGAFHATEDKQIVRDAVFAVLAKYDFRIDATVLEKAKCRPALRETEERFYKTAWFYHMRHLTPRVVGKGDTLFLVAASLGTARKRGLFHQAVREVATQTSGGSGYRTASWPAAVEPCLQVADYCGWAIQRKWERNDTRSYEFIEDKIRSEFDLFAQGKTLYY